MKKNMRIGLIVDEMTSNPCRLYELKYFCEKYDIAKSSLSEDIRLVNQILSENGSGRIESYTGVGGGVRFVPGISREETARLQECIIEKLSDPQRILGGGFIYTSDIMFDGRLLRDMARVFAREFYSRNADYVVTIETKGIPLAAKTAELLNLPLVVIRREAKYSEGSTVSINYFSGSYDRIQKMSIAKRSVRPGTRAIIIDDFMRGGGSLKGITEILGEFDVEVVGIGTALAAREPVNKKVSDTVNLITIDSVDEEIKSIHMTANDL